VRPPVAPEVTPVDASERPAARRLWVEVDASPR
jgi:hypothetical protein